MLFTATKLFHKAGEGSGGGGSVDYNRVVEKITAIPSAESSIVGKVYMYMGETNSTYTHGYIYECVATQEATAVAFSGSIVSSWDVADFVSYMQEGGSAYNEVTHGTLIYDASGGLWDLVGYDANGIEVLSFHEYTEDLEDFGCVFASETHQDGDSCQFTLTTEQSGKKWKRLDVQPNNGGGSDPHNLGWYATESALTTAHPTATDGDWAIVGATDTVWIWDSGTSAWIDSGTAGIELPDQTGNSGKFLTTNGTNASWSDKPLVNTATQPDSGALGILANVTGYEALGIKTNKGFGTRSITIGSGSETQSGTESEMAIGRTTKAFGSYACAIGNQASAYGANCHAIGYNATAGDYQYNSTYGAWQFGSGTNNEPGTVCIALTTTNDYQHWTNYKVLDSDGTIPTARLTKVNTTATLAVADWSSNTQTVSVTGMTATAVVLIAPAPASQADYTDAGIVCTAQAAGTLTFTCDTTPTNAIVVNVVAL